MKTIIAEKPSVARDIARVLGAGQKHDGYIEGQGYYITWAFGHLVGLAMPDAYGYTGWKRENLPILPEQFKIVPRITRNDKGKYETDEGAKKQLDIIDRLLKKSDSIVVATDAGREGELIFRYIYHYLGCTLPFERLWISSLTDKAIQGGFQNLYPGSKYDNLYQAAKARSESDWTIGINGSQALSIAGNSTYSLGRVQTPTLKMICERYLENKNYVPSPFWQLRLFTEKSDIPFSAMTERYLQKESVDSTFAELSQEKTCEVTTVSEKEVSQDAPLLYDLTTLQKEANKKHGLTAEETLNIAQQLYEKKYLTYPRTGSRYISEDVFETIPELLKDDAYFQTLTQLNKRSVNDKKITDHHAIIITENKPQSLTKNEQLIYEMVYTRMLESFSPKCVKKAKGIIIVLKGVEFYAKGSTIVSPGWRAVHNEVEDEEDLQALPDVREGDVLPVNKLESIESKTKPKPLHTEASLLAAMENAGKELEDEEEREALKELGIGTPATRASIIETLFTRTYVVREKKHIIPTQKGLTVYEIVKDMQIANVELTGKWEKAFILVERGEKDVTNFKKGIEDYARKIVAELLNQQVNYTHTDDMEKCTCPKCKKETLILYPKVGKCNECDLTLYRTVAKKLLTDNQMKELLKKGKSGLIKGFKNKEGKSFDAQIFIGEDYSLKFEFPEKK